MAKNYVKLLQAMLDAGADRDEICLQESRDLWQYRHKKSAEEEAVRERFVKRLGQVVAQIERKWGSPDYAGDFFASSVPRWSDGIVWANHGIAYWLREGYAAYVGVGQDEQALPFELILGVLKLPQEEPMPAQPLPERQRRRTRRCT
jgi:hypothetical protein